MKLLFENWRQYEKYHDVLDNHIYITEVLGINLPINESGNVIYNVELRKQIIEEETLLQNWWFGSDTLKEGWWDNLKQNVSAYPDTFKMIYRAVTDPGKLRTFTKAIKRRGLGVKDKILKFCNWIIDKLGGINAAGWKQSMLQKLMDWAKKIKDGIKSILDWISGISKPWMKALGFVALSVGLEYAWFKIAAFASEMMGCGDEEDEEEEASGPEVEAEVTGHVKEIAIDCVMGKIKAFVKKGVMKVAMAAIKKVGDSGNTAVTMGASTFWKWLVAIGKGVKFVVNTLAPTLDFFKARGGLVEHQRPRSLSKKAKMIGAHTNNETPT